MSTIALSFASLLGIATDELKEIAFLALSGLGFIPSLLGTCTQTFSTVSMIISANMENIKHMLSAATDFLKGFAFGGVMAVALPCGGGATDAAKNIYTENMDMGKVEDAENAHEDAQEYVQTWKERVRTVFDALDEDGDGSLEWIEVYHSIKRREIEDIFLHNDVLMSAAMFAKFFAFMSADCTRLVDFETFAQAVRESDPDWHSHDHPEEAPGNCSNPQTVATQNHARQQEYPSSPHSPLSSSIVAVRPDMLRFNRNPHSIFSSTTNSSSSMRTYSTPAIIGQSLPPYAFYKTISLAESEGAMRGSDNNIQGQETIKSKSFLQNLLQRGRLSLLCSKQARQKVTRREAKVSTASGEFVVIPPTPEPRVAAASFQGFGLSLNRSLPPVIRVLPPHLPSPPGLPLLAPYLSPLPAQPLHGSLPPSPPSSFPAHSLPLHQVLGAGTWC
jgi:hypothetical protein